MGRLKSYYIERTELGDIDPDETDYMDAAESLQVDQKARVKAVSRDEVQLEVSIRDNGSKRSN